MTTWRDSIRPIVAEIIRRVGQEDMKLLRQELVKCRPAWVRTCSHQTKIWRDEVNLQLGIKKKAACKTATRDGKHEPSHPSLFGDMDDDVHAM